MEWYIPWLICLARICDVSIGTVRMILVINGQRYTAALLGFFEVIIWVLAVGGAIKYLEHPSALIGYGVGFAVGTLFGMALEERIALGCRLVRVVNPDRSVHVAKTLRDRGYRVTEIEGHGLRGPVEVAFLVIKRRKLRRVLSLIEGAAPNAFVTVERADQAKGQIFTPDPRMARPSWARFGMRK